MKIGIVNVHSFVDVITNSSTEIYVCSKGQSIEFVQKVIESIIKDHKNDDDDYGYGNIIDAFDVYEYTQEMYDKEVRDHIKSTRNYVKSLIKKLKNRKPINDYPSYNYKTKEYKDPKFDLKEYEDNFEYIKIEKFEDEAGNKNWIGKVVVKIDDWIGYDILENVQNALDIDFHEHW